MNFQEQHEKYLIPFYKNQNLIIGCNTIQLLNEHKRKYKFNYNFDYINNRLQFKRQCINMSQVVQPLALQLTLLVVPQVWYRMKILPFKSKFTEENRFNNKYPSYIYNSQDPGLKIIPVRNNCPLLPIEYITDEET
jgi:hypothetical protein